jgi:hypothetical protein
MSARSKAVNTPASCRPGAFALNTGGTLGPATGSSTHVTTLLVHNAGITPVLRFVFEISQALAR